MKSEICLAELINATAQPCALAACGWAQPISFYDNLAGNTTFKNRAVASRLHALVGRFFTVTHLRQRPNLIFVGGLM